MAEHISIRKAAGTWVIRADGAVLGESSEALEVSEGDHPPVIYFPRKDIAMTFLDKTDTVTTCPHKGQATYYAIHSESQVIDDAAWSYENPHKEVAAIADHLAFYPEKATVEQI